MLVMMMAMNVAEWEKDAIASLGSPGIDELKWLKPVYPGDTLHVRPAVELLRAALPEAELVWLCSRYALEAILTPWPADAGEYFGVVSGSGEGASAVSPILYHLGFMTLTLLIVGGYDAPVIELPPSIVRTSPGLGGVVGRA